MSFQELIIFDQAQEDKEGQSTSSPQQCDSVCRGENLAPRAERGNITHNSPFVINHRVLEGSGSFGRLSSQQLLACLKSNIHAIPHCTSQNCLLPLGCHSLYAYISCFNWKDDLGYRQFLPVPRGKLKVNSKAMHTHLHVLGKQIKGLYTSVIVLATCNRVTILLSPGEGNSS